MYLSDNLKQLINTKDRNSIEYAFADYVLQNIYRIENLTIDEMAMHCHTSNASISRLIKNLGFNSYKSFRLECLSIKDAYLNDFSKPSFQSISKEQLISFYTKEFPYYIQSILDEDINKMKNWLLNRNLYLLGNLWEIMRIQYLLSNIFIPSTVLTSSKQIQHLSKQDTIIVLSVSGNLFRSEDETFTYLSQSQAQKYLLTTSKFKNIPAIFDDTISLKNNIQNSHLDHQLFYSFMDLVYCQILIYKEVEVKTKVKEGSK